MTGSLLKIFSEARAVRPDVANGSLKRAILTGNAIKEVFNSLGGVRDSVTYVFRTFLELVCSTSMAGDMALKGGTFAIPLQIGEEISFGFGNGPVLCVPSMVGE